MVDNRLQVSSTENKLESQVGALLDRTPEYNRAPPFTVMQGNCSVGAATYLRHAGVAENDILAPSAFAMGLHHKMHTWKPVGDIELTQAAVSNRGGEVTVADLNAHVGSLKSYLNQLSFHAEGPKTGQPILDNDNTPLDKAGKPVRIDQKPEWLEAALAKKTEKSDKAPAKESGRTVTTSAASLVREFVGHELVTEFVANEQGEQLVNAFAAEKRSQAKL